MTIGNEHNQYGDTFPGEPGSGEGEPRDPSLKDEGKNEPRTEFDSQNKGSIGSQVTENQPQNKPENSQSTKTEPSIDFHRSLPLESQPLAQSEPPSSLTEGRPIERNKAPGRTGARGTAAMDPKTRQEVARKGGIAVSRNKQHMAEIGRKGGQSVSKNREHMAQIGRKGGAASRGHR